MRNINYRAYTSKYRKATFDTILSDNKKSYKGYLDGYADRKREAVTKGELVLDWINEVADKIYVYDKDKVEIVWKFE